MAGKAIKGITIRLEGDNGPLASSMTQADKTIASVEKSLKAVNKALKLDPTNTELLKQKQSLLNQEIAATREKLNAEKEAAELAKVALEEGAMTKDEYDALQVELQGTAGKLKELQQEAREFGSVTSQQMQEVGQKLQDVGGKMEQFGQNMTTHVTAPILAAGAAAVSSFQEVDGGLDNIIRKTGATGESLDEYEGIMERIATTIPTDFDTAGNAIGEVATRFHLSGQELEDLSTQFIEFSSITGTDVTQAVDNTQKALSAFGLDADQAGALLDRLARVSQDTGANVSTLSDGLVQNSAAFMALGLNIDQAAVFMGQMETSGANAESVMQALRKGLKSSAQDGSDFAAELQNLQNEIINGTDDMDGLTLAYEMFGRSGDQIYSALRSGTLDFTTMGNAAEEAGGTVATTFDATVDPLTQAQTTGNQLKLTMGDIGESVVTSLVPALETLNTNLQGLNDWWNSLDQSEQNNILTVVAIAAAIGPLIMIIGSLISSVGSIISFFGMLSGLVTGTVIPGVVSLVGTITGMGIPAFIALAAPIAAVVAVIGAVVAVVMAVKSVFDHSDAWMWAFEQLWNRLGDTVDSIKEGISNAVSTIGEAFENIWGNIEETFSSLIEGAVTWGSDLIDSFVSGITSGISSIGTAASNIASTVRDYIGFSEPEKGPLSDFHTFSPDLVDLWNEGIYNNLDSVARGASVMAQTVATPMETVNASGAAVASAGSMAAPAINFTAVIGGRRFREQVVNATAENNYYAGG